MRGTSKSQKLWYSLTDFLGATWLSTWNNLGLQGDPWVPYIALAKDYGQKGRHYHTFSHVEDCLRTFNSVSHLIADPTPCASASFITIALYYTARHDNEERAPARR